GIEEKGVALVEHHRAALEPPDPQLRSLQVDKDPDRPPILEFHRTNEPHELAHALVRGMAHVDAENVGARPKQVADNDPLGRRRTERRNDLGPAQTSHQFLLRGDDDCAGGGRPETGGGCTTGTRCCNGCCGAASADSVSCTVQFGCSPVSTSKKPVRSKPRARQSSVPLIVNSLSRVHMKACPDHSPLRS